MNPQQKSPDSVLQEYIDASGDGFWDWHLRDDYEYMSPRFWAMFGYLPEEKPHCPSAWMELIFEEDLALAKKKLDKHFQTKGEHPFEQEARYKHRNGSTVTVLCRGRVVEWGETGDPVRMLGTHTDITRLKNTEAELAAVKARYDLAVRGSGVGLWDWDIEKDTLYWSERYLQMLGIVDNNFKPTYDDFNERIHPDDRLKVSRAVQLHLREKQHYDVEFRIRCEDGSYIWMLARGQALWDSRGVATRMAGSIDNISQAKNNAFALQKAVDFQNLVMNTNTDLFFVKDENFRIVEANKAFLNLYPADIRDSVVGTTTLEEYDKEQAEEFLAEDRKAFADGVSEVVETINFPDGEERTLLTKKIRFEDLNSEAFILGVSRDITEIKRAEQRLIHLNEQLEEFAYRTSHDLRSPLVSSAKLLEIIQGAMEQEQYGRCLRYLPIVRDAISTMETLVSDILTVSKINHCDENREAITVKELFDACLVKFSHLDGFDDVKMTFNDHYQKMIWVQKLQMDLVVENLISNTIKYRDTSKSQQFVNIDIEEINQCWQLSVTDNGIGIPERYKTKLFSMFKRFHSGVGFGSGLGLYMVKQSVERMGGTINYSDTGTGSKFVVCIPIKRLQEV